MSGILRIFRTDKEIEFLSIFKKHANGVYRYACGLLSDQYLAEDVTQETFMRLYNTLNDGHEVTNPRAWLTVTARNLCLNLKRQTRREILSESADACHPQQETADFEVKRGVNTALGQLDDKQREALILKEYEGYSYEEIAGIMGTTVPGVRSLLYRARLELKNRLGQLYNRRQTHAL